MTTNRFDSMLRWLCFLLTMNYRDVADHDSDEVLATGLMPYYKSIKLAQHIILSYITF
jgi:hypothetical protein